MSYQSYKDLKIYKRSHRLAVEVHEMSLKLPKFELYEQGSQIRRASKSIFSNIVEGFGRRRYKAEFIKSLTYSLASCDETKEHLDILFETKSLKDKKVYEFLLNKYEELGKMIAGFIKSVEFGHKTKTSI